MFPYKEIIKRFEEILLELDALTEACGGDAAEALEDLNAEMEDILLLISELRLNTSEDAEEFADAMEDVRALAGDYHKLAAQIPELTALSDRLDMAAEMVIGNTAEA